MNQLIILMFEYNEIEDIYGTWIKDLFYLHK